MFNTIGSKKPNQPSNTLKELSLNSFCFNIEKKANKGEDADPVILLEKYFTCISTFDGLGGAGSHLVTINEQKYTGAYCASRHAAKKLADFCKERLNACLPNEIENTIKTELEPFLQKHFKSIDRQATPSQVKSKMFKNFPTTMAAIFLLENNEKLLAITVWAGDSRSYLMTEQGFSVLSYDDTDITINSSLYKYTGGDAPMQNCLSSDNDFYINFSEVQIEEPCILLTATDGCFAYLKTPFHFEYYLLKFLLEAETMDSWKDKIITFLKKVSGDDFSMALLSIGFLDFEACKQYYLKRYEVLSNHINNLNQTHNTIAHSKEIITINENKLVDEENTIWDEYKKVYFNRIKQEGE